MTLFQEKTVAIIGGGFSGTATAINLLSQAGEQQMPLRVVLIDRTDATGKGLAYATEDDNLVLNVPIGNMSVFADRPDDFLDYCHEIDAALNPGSFIFRRVYGEYLKTRLQQAQTARPGMLLLIDDQVEDLHPGPAGQWLLTCVSGKQIRADRVVLAFGHFAPRSIADMLGEKIFSSTIPPRLCVDNPWDICAVDALPLDKDVLIVGTGHTAIDILFRLVSSSPPRKIVMISRHGESPNGHRKAGEFVKIPPLHKEIEVTVKSLLARLPTIRALLSAVRQLIRQHGAQGGNWRDVINGLRQITPDIWMALPFRERARFLRHVVYHWDVRRHRLAPIAIRRLEGLVASGRVEVIAGRLTRLNFLETGNEIDVEVQLRGAQLRRSMRVGSVINCTGPNYDIHRVSNLLVSRLAKRGLLQQDAVKIGFAVDDRYRCSTLPNLYYIGPMLKARYWEAIAVPELRVHARNLAQIVLSA